MNACAHSLSSGRFDPNTPVDEDHFSQIDFWEKWEESRHKSAVPVKTKRQPKRKASDRKSHAPEETEETEYNETDENDLLSHATDDDEKTKKGKATAMRHHKKKTKLQQHTKPTSEKLTHKAKKGRLTLTLSGGAVLSREEQE